MAEQSYHGKHWGHLNKTFTFAIYKSDIIFTSADENKFNKNRGHKCLTCNYGVKDGEIQM